MAGGRGTVGKSNGLHSASDALARSGPGSNMPVVHHGKGSTRLDDPRGNCGVKGFAPRKRKHCILNYSILTISQWRIKHREDSAPQVECCLLRESKDREQDQLIFARAGCKKLSIKTAPLIVFM